MTLRFEHAEIETLLNELESRTGRGREDVILDALRHERERLEDHKAQQRAEALKSARLMRESWHRRPLVDARSISDILGHDENGLPI